MPRAIIRSMRTISILSLSILLMAGIAIADEAKKKPLSPAANAGATLNNKKIVIDYSAPSKRGRAIMGKLVPYAKVWRTGANAATTLKTEGDLMIGTVHVPAGTYTLFTIPGEKEWTLIINKQKGQWGTDYDESQDLGRTKMAVKKLAAPVETFKIAFVPVNPNQATLQLSWENVEATARVLAH
jgi:hypothetical protein